MDIKSKDELHEIKEECHKLATKRAAVAAGVAITPVPGLDIAVDITLLLEAMPTIVKKFGLSKEQIDEYNEDRKVLIYTMIKKLGVEAVGVMITEEVIKKVITKVATRAVAKSMAKYIPIVGSAIAASVGFAAMKLILDDLTSDCYKVSLELLSTESKNTVQ